MTALQRLQLKQSELRSKIAAELDKEEKDREEGGLERMTAQMQALEVEVRAALVVEESNQEPADTEGQETSEQREFNELRSAVNMGPYLQAALTSRGVMAGPELEYNQAIGLREDYFDLALLEDGDKELETRAARDGDARANQSSWLDRVFENTAAMHLGVTMRSVNPGVHSIPLTSAGGSPVQRGRTEAVTESTYTVAVTDIKPSRAAVHGIYSIEDDLRLPGLADAIQRDMRMAMTERIDRKIFSGDTGANEAVADIAGLNTYTGIGEKTITQANKVKAVETLKAFTDLVDGKYSNMISDLSVVASVGSYRLWESTIANSAAENQTVAGFLRAAGLSWRSRGGIETATGNNKFGGYVGLPNGRAGAAVAAVWRGAQLIRDQYTSAVKGEVELTMNYFWNFKIPRTANFKRLKYIT